MHESQAETQNFSNPSKGSVKDGNKRAHYIFYFWTANVICCSVGAIKSVLFNFRIEYYLSTIIRT